MRIAVGQFFKAHDAGRRANWREFLAFDAFGILLVLRVFLALVVNALFIERVNETENMIGRICFTKRIRLEPRRERKREHETWKHGFAAIDHQMDGRGAFRVFVSIGNLFTCRGNGAANFTVPFADSRLLHFFLLFSHDL